MDVTILRHFRDDEHYLEVTSPTLANTWIPIRNLTYEEALNWQRNLLTAYGIGGNEVREAMREALKE